MRRISSNLKDHIITSPDYRFQKSEFKTFRSSIDLDDNCDSEPYFDYSFANEVVSSDEYQVENSVENNNNNNIQ